LVSDRIGHGCRGADVDTGERESLEVEGGDDGFPIEDPRGELDVSNIPSRIAIPRTS
jgi:hypothetical protein